MHINWPWSKSYRVTCNDGSFRIVFKDINDAFPLNVKDIKANIQADIKGLESLQGNMKSEYSTQIKGLLYGLDEFNNDMMVSFRTLYIAYSADPCNNSFSFQKFVEQMIERQQRIKYVRMKIQGLIEFVKTKEVDPKFFLEKFMEVADQLGDYSGSEVSKIEISSNRELAQKWTQKKNQ